MKISIFLNQIPRTLIENNEIFFDNKKSEVIFYYMVLRGKVSRTGLAYQIWPDSNESAARKNLRNHLYYIRKTIGRNIFNTSKDILSVDNDVEVEVIVDSAGNRIMEGICLPESDEIQSFFMDLYDKHSELYMVGNRKQLDDGVNEKNESKVRKAYENITKIDPYDEESCRKMMLFYLNFNSYNKGIEIYLRMRELLKADLNEMPEKETSEIYGKLVSLKKDSQGKAKRNFFGRSDEIIKINEQYSNFINGLDYSNIIIYGGVGTGKTFLMNNIIRDMNDDDNVIRINLSCFEIENDFSFKAIYKFTKQVLDLMNRKVTSIKKDDIDLINKFLPFLSYENIGSDHIDDDVERMTKVSYIQFEEAFMSICLELTRSNKLLITIDDIHNMDFLSLRLLSNLFMGRFKDKILLLSTCRRNQIHRIVDLTDIMINKNDLMMVELDNFSFADVEKIIGKRIEHDTDPDLVNKLYRETKGNPLFLFEYIESMENGNKTINEFKFISIFKNKYEMLSDLHKRILSVSSTFFDVIDYRIVSDVLKLDELKILESLDELVRMGCLIEEYDNDDISIAFFHDKFREYIYDSLSGLILRRYHSDIAENIEKRLTGTARDYLEYNRLVYHYRIIGNRNKYLKYVVKKYEFLLNPNIEYPEYISSINNEDLVNLNKEINKLDRDNDIWIDFQILKGAYEIKNCMYEDGKNSVLAAIDNAKAYNALYKAYNQMIYYSIQIRDLDQMHDYLCKLKALTDKDGSRFEIGKLKRLWGLYRIMNGGYDKAESELKDSIEIFGSSSDMELSPLNLASSYNYLGYIYKYKGDYIKATEYYKKAVEICLDSNILSGQTVYYTNLGQSLYELGRFSEAKEYLLKSETLHKKVFTIWSKPLTECYLSLIHFNEGDYKLSHKYLESSILHAKKLKNPYESSFVLKAMVLIKVECLKNSELNSIFSDILDKDVRYYVQEAIDSFKVLKMTGEIDFLEELLC
ncbi:Predicted ATPase [Dethiosulfatibacter aminovorans DSM 17477]|uniref:Predicted ATPase n=1 Tax=Dethiosulfatibacter aminovorans DSM 17477 TaxID=1121476 RepID=A0A1M6IHS7_9FIRM|nr:tetratricopeptide repeat protein [Dethiosulfatibacter aminovorans]SHJ33963.1 Predicted ATPase [Dethiosulfatibacter aminovorans DSM 17477]